ncbi:MAG: tRNA(His) guanylyltransferase Thg1 family protein [Thiolinea sp.]
MKFDDLDKKMRVFEMAHDVYVLPEIYMVARIDGRSFTRLTKETHAFEAPFDVRVRDMMTGTIEHLMQCGFKVVYGYTQSDEISLLFSLNEDSFQRKERKFNSVLAGEASAKFSLLLGDLASFDCRICQLPTVQLVVDYFRWRQEDAHRNALHAHCYWKARSLGASANQAATLFSGKSIGAKNEYLFQQGINFNELPAWQKRGTGVYWESFSKDGLNKKTGESTQTTRRRLKVDYELPMKDKYDAFIGQFVAPG